MRRLQPYVRRQQRIPHAAYLPQMLAALALQLPGATFVPPPVKRAATRRLGLTLTLTLTLTLACPRELRSGALVRG